MQDQEGSRTLIVTAFSLKEIAGSLKLFREPALFVYLCQQNQNNINKKTKDYEKTNDNNDDAGSNGDHEHIVPEGRHNRVVQQAVNGNGEQQFQQHEQQRNEQRYGQRHDDGRPDLV
jgi:hypothetical protein